MHTSFKKSIKKGIKKAIDLFGIDMGGGKRLYPEPLSVEDELYRHWSEVGEYMHNAMKHVDREISKNPDLIKKNDGAQMSIDFDEHRENQDLEHA